MFTPQQLSDQIKKLTDQTTALAEAQELYREAIKDPAYQKMADWLKTETRLTEDYLKIEREVSQLKIREAAITSGDLERHLTRQNQLRVDSVRLSRTESILAAEARRDYLTSGNYAKQVDAMRPANAMNAQSAHAEQLLERVSAAQIRAEALRSGEFQTAARGDESTSRYERMSEAQETRIRARENLTGRRDDLRTGYTRDQALADARVKIERDRVERAEAKAMRSGYLEARYGFAGGAVVQASESPGMRGVLGALGNVGTRAYSAAMSGFGGTVEMNRFNRETQLISREFASALKPALEGATSGLHRFSSWMAGLSSGQQDAIMYGTLATVGVKAASMVSHRALGMGLIEAGAAGAAWYRGGAAPGAAAGAAASRLRGVPPPASGARAGGLAGAAAAGLAAVPLVGIALGALSGLSAAKDAFVGDDEKGSTYSRLRGKGYSRGGAGAWSATAAFADFAINNPWNMATSAVGLDDWRVRTGAERLGVGADTTGPGGHRRVTQADVGFSDTGSFYDRATMATDMLDTQMDLAKALDRLSAAIEAQNGSAAPPPQRGS